MERVEFIQPYGRFVLTRTGDVVQVHIDRSQLHPALSAGRGIRTPWFAAVGGVQTFPFPGGGQATLNGSAIVVSAGTPDDSGDLDFEYETSDPPTDYSPTRMVLPISATANAGTILCELDGDYVTLTIDNAGATASVGTGSPWGLPWPAIVPLDPTPRPMPVRGTVVIADTITDSEWGATFGGFTGMAPFPVPDGNALVVTYTTSGEAEPPPPDDDEVPDDLAAAVRGLVDQLVGAGVRANDDPRDINPPCVHVRPPELEYRFGKGGYTATWNLWCIVPDSGRHQSLKSVSQLIAQTQTALGWKAVSARPDDVLLNDGGSSPMYVLTFTERIH